MENYYEAYEKRYRQVHGRGLSWASEKNSPIVLEMLEKYGKTGGRILDVGCGEGRDCLFLLKRGCDVQAVDISEEAIRYCRERAGKGNESRFHVADVCRGELAGEFDFIYSVATLHMLVLQEDRERYLAFIREHLAQGGYALILSMGDGVQERESDIRDAFEDVERSHWETGEELMIAATSCKIVSLPTFRRELEKSGLVIAEDGMTGIEPDFPFILYAVVQRIGEKQE